MIIEKKKYPSTKNNFNFNKGVLEEVLLEF